MQHKQQQPCPSSSSIKQFHQIQGRVCCCAADVMMHLMQCTGNEGQGRRQESKPDFIVFYVLIYALLMLLQKW